MDRDEAAQAFREFVEIIRALRAPGTGCPWDLEQDHHTLRPYVLEEANEVLDAIDRGDDRLATGKSWATCCCKCPARPGGRRPAAFSYH